MNMTDTINKQIEAKCTQIDEWTEANPHVTDEMAQEAYKHFMITDIEALMATGTEGEKDAWRKANRAMELHTLGKDLEMLKNTASKILEGTVIKITQKYLVMSSDHHPISPSGFAPTDPIVLINGGTALQMDTLPKYLSPNLHAFNMESLLQAGAALDVD